MDNFWAKVLATASGNVCVLKYVMLRKAECFHLLSRMGMLTVKEAYQTARKHFQQNILILDLRLLMGL